MIFTFPKGGYSHVSKYWGTVFAAIVIWFSSLAVSVSKFNQKIKALQ